MRSPWIDLLFLHGYLTPTQANQLTWREAAQVDHQKRFVDVDVADLPLRRIPKTEITCCS